MRSARDNLKFLDDLAKAATGAMGPLGGLSQEVRRLVKEHFRDVHTNMMDLVSREEFERVEAMAEKARERQLELEKRLAVLEKQVKGTTSKRKKK